MPFSLIHLMLSGYSIFSEVQKCTFDCVFTAVTTLQNNPVYCLSNAPKLYSRVESNKFPVVTSRTSIAGGLNPSRAHHSTASCATDRPPRGVPVKKIYHYTTEKPGGRGASWHPCQKYGAPSYLFVHFHGSHTHLSNL